MKGMTNDPLLQEDYLDWFFLRNFGKGPGFWRSLPEDKLNNIIEFQILKEEQYWETWVEIYKKVWSK